MNLLAGHPFDATPNTRLYQASDMLMKHRAAIEDHIFSSVQSLFSLDETVTLYDLTNTYFEGDAESNMMLTGSPSTVAEPDLMAIYNALKISPAPEGVKKLNS